MAYKKIKFIGGLILLLSEAGEAFSLNKLTKIPNQANNELLLLPESTPTPAWDTLASSGLLIPSTATAEIALSKRQNAIEANSGTVYVDISQTLIVGPHQTFFGDGATTIIDAGTNYYNSGATPTTAIQIGPATTIINNGVTTITPGATNAVPPSATIPTSLLATTTATPTSLATTASETSLLTTQISASSQSTSDSSTTLSDSTITTSSLISSTTKSPTTFSTVTTRATSSTKISSTTSSEAPLPTASKATKITPIAVQRNHDIKAYPNSVYREDGTLRITGFVPKDQRRPIDIVDILRNELKAYISRKNPNSLWRAEPENNQLVVRLIGTSEDWNATTRQDIIDAVTIQSHQHGTLNLPTAIKIESPQPESEMKPLDQLKQIEIRIAPPQAELEENNFTRLEGLRGSRIDLAEKPQSPDNIHRFFNIAIEFTNPQEAEVGLETLFGLEQDTELEQMALLKLMFSDPQITLSWISETANNRNMTKDPITGNGLPFQDAIMGFIRPVAFETNQTVAYQWLDIGIDEITGPSVESKSYFDFNSLIIKSRVYPNFNATAEIDDQIDQTLIPKAKELTQTFDEIIESGHAEELAVTLFNVGLWGGISDVMTEASLFGLAPQFPQYDNTLFSGLALLANEVPNFLQTGLTGRSTPLFTYLMTSIISSPLKNEFLNRSPQGQVLAQSANTPLAGRAMARVLKPFGPASPLFYENLIRGRWKEALTIAGFSLGLSAIGTYANTLLMKQRSGRHRINEANLHLTKRNVFSQESKYFPENLFYRKDAELTNWLHVNIGGPILNLLSGSKQATQSLEEYLENEIDLIARMSRMLEKTLTSQASLLNPPAPIPGSTQLLDDNNNNNNNNRNVRRDRIHRMVQQIELAANRGRTSHDNQATQESLPTQDDTNTATQTTGTNAGPNRFPGSLEDTVEPAATVEAPFNMQALLRDAIDEANTTIEDTKQRSQKLLKDLLNVYKEKNTEDNESWWKRLSSKQTKSPDNFTYEQFEARKKQIEQDTQKAIQMLRDDITHFERAVRQLEKGKRLRVDGTGLTEHRSILGVTEDMTSHMPSPTREGSRGLDQILAAYRDNMSRLVSDPLTPTQLTDPTRGFMTGGGSGWPQRTEGQPNPAQQGRDINENQPPIEASTRSESSRDGSDSNAAPRDDHEEARGPRPQRRDSDDDSPPGLGGSSHHQTTTTPLSPTVVNTSHPQASGSNSAGNTNHPTDENHEGQPVSIPIGHDISGPQLGGKYLVKSINLKGDQLKLVIVPWKPPSTQRNWLAFMERHPKINISIDSSEIKEDMSIEPKDDIYINIKSRFGNVVNLEISRIYKRPKTQDIQPEPKPQRTPSRS